MPCQALLCGQMLQRAPACQLDDPLSQQVLLLCPARRERPRQALLQGQCQQLAVEDRHGVAACGSIAALQLCRQVQEEGPVSKARGLRLWRHLCPGCLQGVRDQHSMSNLVLCRLTAAVVLMDREYNLVLCRLNAAVVLMDREYSHLAYCELLW